MFYGEGKSPCDHLDPFLLLTAVERGKLSHTLRALPTSPPVPPRLRVNTQRGDTLLLR